MFQKALKIFFKKLVPEKINNHRINKENKKLQPSYLRYKNHLIQIKDLKVPQKTKEILFQKEKFILRSKGLKENSTKELCAEKK